MIMEEKVPFGLLAKFITGQGTPDENKRAGEWIELSSQNREIYNQLVKIWERSRKTQTDFTPDIEKALEAVNAKLSQENLQDVSNTAKSSKLLRFLLRIAAVLMVMAGSWIIFNQIQHREEIMTADNTGKPMDVRLPDGSLVTLNTGATLRYPHVFRKQKREVKLSGEAFFDVSSNPGKPFIVKTENTFIRVLGTSFNVRALKNEASVVVTVEEGRVEFGSVLEPEKSGVEIAAGETGILEKGKSPSIASTRDNNYLAWKTGILTFHKAPVTEVIHAVEKYFFVRIQSENRFLDSVSVDVTLYRENKAEMIKTIEMLIGFSIIPKDSLYIITAEPI